MVRTSHQCVQMIPVEGADPGFDFLLNQSLDDLVEDELTKLAVDLYGVALHQGFGIIEERVVFSFWRRVLVVAVDVFAVVAGAPTSGITTQPGTVGVRDTVVPVVPRVHDLSMTTGIE